MTQLDFNLIDVDNLVNKFLLDRQSGLVTLHKIYFKNNQQMSYRVFVEELFEELKNGCITFITKNNSIEDLETYLFYIANDFGKKQTVSSIKKNKEFICPGCLFLGKENLLSQEVQLICYTCNVASKKATESKWLDFFNCFKKHSKVGFRCLDCNRFIPQPLSKSTSIICPYIDCLFVGSSNDLKKMTHPNLDSKIKQIPSLDKLQITSTETETETDLKIEIQQDIDLKIKTIKDVIDQQSSAIHWNSFNFTIKHKAFVYQAFKNILEKFPIEMTSYLLESSRSGGFQHKLFQEYISILESNLPIPYKKDKKIKSIESLLDSELSLFDGISVFEGEISNNCIIKNNTQEIYIGGRKATHVKPFYIGKLLNIVLTDTNEPIMHLVKNYSFSRIKLSELPKSSKVIVTHLRVPPHYQMGGMVYVNRIRKNLIDKVKLILENEKL